jgi:hypothetical protein
MNINYSPKLDSMTRVIRIFLSENKDHDVVGRTYRAVEDFCYGYPSEFKLQFLNHIGLIDTKSAMPHSNDQSAETEFCELLFRRDGEAIFLLRDTKGFFDFYKQKTGRGTGILINRNFIGGEDVYFDLIKCAYDTFNNEIKLPVFIEKYVDRIRELISNSEDLADKARKIFEMVKGKKSIIWVDVGFQFTMNLFCYACVCILSRDKIAQDMYNFTVCPWLADLFNGKYFTSRNELGFNIESKNSVF